MKKCNKCGIEKENLCFERQRAQCKECRATYRSEYAQTKTGRAARNKAQANYYSSQKGKEADKKYKQSDKGKQRRKIRDKVKRDTNPTIKLRDMIRGSINKALHRINKSKNGNSCLNYLPYTMEELKDHLESLFEPWMTWDNHGPYNAKTWKDDDQTTWTWHLDHKIAHSTFHYISMKDQAFRDCWALNNLQPLSAKENILKRAK